MIKILLSTGGTGGHIFPILSLYKELKKNENIKDVKIITDKRAKKFIDFDDFKIINVDSPFRKKGVIHLIKTFFYIFYSTFRCFLIIIFFNPKIVIGSGGYVSFPVLLACILLRKKFILYETNAVLGRVNRLFLPYCFKLLSGYPDIRGLPHKYLKKFNHVGQLVRDKFLQISNEIVDTNSSKINDKVLNILILGGSQGAKVLGEKLPKCFKSLDEKKIKLSIKQQVQKNQLEVIRKFYNNNIKSHAFLFEFNKNIENYIIEADVIICRSGSSTIAELSILNKPFIAIPLPGSLDNHQYFNAKYFHDKDCCWLLDENTDDFEHKIITILKDIYNSDDLLNDKKNNLTRLNKKNAIKHFIAEIL